MNKIKQSNNKISLRALVTLGMLTAVAFVLYLLEFPLLPAAAHLKMDFSDAAALAGGILYGPLAAVLIEVLKNVLHLLFRGLGEQLGFGNIMNLMVGIAYVLPFLLVRTFCQKRKLHAAAGFVLSAASAAVVMVLVGFAGNLFFTPLYFRYMLHIDLPRAAVTAAAWTGTLFNVIKVAILTVLALPLQRICETVKRRFALSR